MGKFRFTTAERNQIKEAYIWLDWFSVPQVVGGPRDEDEVCILRRMQLMCIRSIPSYVESSEMFVALVPPLQNKSTGVVCDFRSWLGRGWCLHCKAIPSFFAFCFLLKLGGEMLT